MWPFSLLKENLFYKLSVQTKEGYDDIYLLYMSDSAEIFAKELFSMLKENEFYILRLYIKQGL